jgi:hypothetical protein
LFALTGIARCLSMVQSSLSCQKGVVPKRISSEVLLKRVDNICHRGWKQTPLEFIGGDPNFGNGKLNLPFLSLGEGFGASKMGQGPRQLIECCPKATNEVSDKHGNEFWCDFIFNPNDVDEQTETLGGGLSYSRSSSEQSRRGRWVKMIVYGSRGSNSSSMVAYRSNISNLSSTLRLKFRYNSPVTSPIHGSTKFTRSSYR